MNYRKRFKKYLDDLSQRRPSPGGGSALCLNFCLGVSLIEKAINYSLDKEAKLPIRDSKLAGGRYLMRLGKLKEEVYLYIDLDSQLFDKVMKARAKERQKLLKRSEKLIVDVARACESVFSLAKGVESGIKKSIISDFHIGLEFVRSALFGCVANLEANTKIFGRSNKYMGDFKKTLNQWQKF
ncbi:MAG: cyclodeaminase/cyclohydrolase family protein [Candidatus Omnitrophota bacterium]|nr:MAG: cyclodeaminase/cyclohydrolase family protein [Candidatus Omnitrophota bacterium]